MRTPAGSVTCAGRSGGASQRGKYDLPEHGFAQFGLSSGELAHLENVGREIRRLAPGEAPRQVEGHCLLNLVDEIHQRLRAPVGQETISDQWRSAGAFHRIAVTSRALSLVKLLSPCGLPNGVHTFRYRSHFRGLPGKQERPEKRIAVGCRAWCVAKSSA